MPTPLPKLTPKQKKFIISYLTHFNGAKAAREAGYSHRTAVGIAAENLSKPHIQRYIKRHLDRYALSAEEVVAKLGMMARGEIPTKTIHRNGEVQEFYEEQAALQDVAKVHGLFVDHHTIEKIDGIEIVDYPILEPDQTQLQDPDYEDDD